MEWICGMGYIAYDAPSPNIIGARAMEAAK
jgi:hypothetical protein